MYLLFSTYILSFFTFVKLVFCIAKPPTKNLPIDVRTFSVSLRKASVNPPKFKFLIPTRALKPRCQPSKEFIG